MRGRKWAIALVIIAIALDAFIIAALANAKILSVFGAEVGLIATSDLYASLVFSAIIFLALLALFLIVLKSHSEGAIDQAIRSRYQESVKEDKLIAWQDGYKEAERIIRREYDGAGQIAYKHGYEMAQREADRAANPDIANDAPIIVKSPAGAVKVSPAPSPPDGTVAAAEEGFKAMRKAFAGKPFTISDAAIDPSSLPMNVQPYTESVVFCPQCGKRLRELISLSNPDQDHSLYCVACGFAAPKASVQP